MYMKRCLSIARIDHEDGVWELIIENTDQVSDDLFKFETELFEWAISAGYFEAIFEHLHNQK
jgi:hypothetical protein